MDITISQAIGKKQLIAERLAELIALRNQNAFTERTRYIGAGAERMVQETPKFDAAKLDLVIQRLHREQRVLDEAIKSTNAATKLAGYNWDDAVLGDLEVTQAAA